MHTDKNRRSGTLPQMQPALHREGYAIFVRCCGLTSETPVGEFAAGIEALDGILLGQVSEAREDFFPSPFGGAIYRSQIDDALAAARALARDLGAAGIVAGIGVAWGRFQRTVNVQEWNASALPLNQAARLAFCDSAPGRVLVTPHVRCTAGARLAFSDERDCVVKGTHYAYHAIESPGYSSPACTDPLSPRTVSPAAAKVLERNIVLWDVVKYSTRDSDEQAELAQSIAQIAATTLHTQGALEAGYSPTGDGGFALFDTGLQAIDFAKKLGRYAVSRGVVIRTGIGHGEVAFAKRGAVGPGVVRADAISALAPHGGIAILFDVWDTLDGVSKEGWRVNETATKGIFALEGPAETGERNVPSAGAVAAASAQSIWNIGRPISHFQDRPELIGQIDRALERGVTALTALSGLGGIG